MNPIKRYNISSLRRKMRLLHKEAEDTINVKYIDGELHVTFDGNPITKIVSDDTTSPYTVCLSALPEYINHLRDNYIQTNKSVCKPSITLL